MRHLRIIAFLLLLLLLLSCVAAKPFDILKGKVVKIQDGDTITILVGKTQHRIRLADIDCPEKKQAYGNKATQFTSDKVFGKTVKVQFTEKDFYGRILGTVYTPEGENLNEELLKAGLAWHYKQYSKDEKLAALEDDARLAKRGLWAENEPMAPWEFRRKK